MGPRLIAPLTALLVAGCAGGIATAPPEPAAAPERTSPVAPPPAAPDPAARRAAKLACERRTIAAVGDIMLGTDYPENRLPEAGGGTLLDKVAPTIRSADIAVGNLEGVLMDGGEPVKTCRNPAACYLFRSPAGYAADLAAAGFDVLSLANNHARDFGEAGRSATMAALDAVGIRHSGRVGESASWSDGIARIAFIAFSPFGGSWPMLDTPAAGSAVAALAREHDIVIVSFHGGGEGADAGRIPFATEYYLGENRGNVVEFSRAMIDAGADLVIGHGPHVPRAMEMHDNRLIAYSLGNFATWYGISVRGRKGLAPVLIATLDGNGALVEGRITSFVQQRPGGPVADRRLRAYAEIRDLTRTDFGGGGIIFSADGSFRPGGARRACRPGTPP